MDMSHFLLSPVGSLPCSPSPLAARFRDNFDLPPSCKSEFADNLAPPPTFIESQSSGRYPVEKSAVRVTMSSRNPYLQEMSHSPPRLRRLRTLDLEADDLTTGRAPVPASSRSPSPPPYGYYETFSNDDDEDDISAEEHAIMAARSRAVHAERVAKFHEQELSFRIRSLRASRSQPTSPSHTQSPFAWCQARASLAIEDPVTEAEYRRARAEVRRRRRSERTRVIELGNILEAHRARYYSPPRTPPPSYDSDSALGLGLVSPPAAPGAYQIVAQMILKRRESASTRVPSGHGLETRRNSSSLRFETLGL